MRLHAAKNIHTHGCHQRCVKDQEQFVGVYSGLQNGGSSQIPEVELLQAVYQLLQLGRRIEGLQSVGLDDLLQL